MFRLAPRRQGAAIDALLYLPTVPIVGQSAVAYCCSSDGKLALDDPITSRIHQIGVVFTISSSSMVEFRNRNRQKHQKNNIRPESTR
jgi:hypothetical protein